MERQYFTDVPLSLSLDSGMLYIVSPLSVMLLQFDELSKIDDLRFTGQWECKQ